MFAGLKFQHLGFMMHRRLALKTLVIINILATNFALHLLRVAPEEHSVMITEIPLHPKANQ